MTDSIVERAGGSDQRFGRLLERVYGASSRRAARAWRTRTSRMHNARPIVSFSFDDFPANAATVGASILEDQGIRGTFYLSGGLIGTTWETGPQATANDVRRLVARGHEIGCHTLTHPRCQTLTTDDLAAQVKANRGLITDMLGDYEVSTFAFPYGQFGLTSKRYFQSQFAACRGILPGVNQGWMDLGLLKAVEIPRSADEGAAWLGPWLDQLRRSNGWLILFTHDVADDAGPFGCTPEALKAAVATALEAGCDVLPVGTAVRVATGADA